MRTRSTALVLALLLAALVLPTAVQAAPTSQATRFYLHRAAGEGTGCGTDLYMNRVPSPGDSGCTPTFRAADIFDDKDDFVLRASELPLVLDADKDLAGQVTMNGNLGVSDFDLVVTVSGTLPDDFVPVQLAQSTTHMTLRPQQTQVHTFSVDIPAEFDNAQFDSLTTTIELRNVVSALGPSVTLNGATHITLHRMVG